MHDVNWISLLLVALVSVAVVGFGILRRPGFGVILAILVIGLVIWRRPDGLSQIGFERPENWVATVTAGFLLGCLFAIVSLTLIDPATERLTGKPHDISVVKGVRGNLRALVLWLAVVWVLVAFLEEIIFRGFLMTELKRLMGDSPMGLAANLLLTSLLFGLAHWYQGPSGAVSTGIVGMMIGVTFIASGFNLWLPVLVHGFIDTVAMVLIYRNLDTKLKHIFIRQPQ